MSTTITLEPGSPYDTFLIKSYPFQEDYFLQNPDGSPMNLTGFTFTSELRKQPGDVTAVAAFTMAIVNASTGHISRRMESTTSDGIAVGDYVSDIRAAPSGSDAFQIMPGAFTVKPRVTV